MAWNDLLAWSLMMKLPRALVPVLYVVSAPSVDTPQFIRARDALRASVVCVVAMCMNRRNA